MRRTQRHAEFRRMILQGAGLIAAELAVIGADLDVLLAQILGEDSSDFAVADESNVPLI